MASGWSDPIKRRSKLPASEKKSFSFRGAFTCGSQFWPDCLAASIAICCHFDFFFFKIDNRAPGDERRDFRSSDLDRLLHDQVHIFSLRNRLSECDPATEWRRFSFL